jgi:DNA methyltransferase 1-associated protein 1
VEYADYPYARFDVHLDPLVYSTEEYEKYLESDVDGNDYVGGSSADGLKKEMELIVRDKQQLQQQRHLVHSKVYPWTKSETDTLLDLARLYDLRWPIIIDKWRTQFANVASCQLRQIEDLQYRYYEVGMILAARRAGEVLANEVELIDKENKKEEETKKKEDVIVPPSGAAKGEGGNKGGGNIAVPTAFDTVDGAAKIKYGDGLISSANNTVDTTSIPMASTTSNSVEQQQPDKEVIDALHRTHRQVTIDPSLVPPLSLPATGTSTHRLRGSGGGGAGAGNVIKGAVFDLPAERARRAHLDRLWHRSKEEEMEEEGLRAELRLVEAQLRKLKRSGKHLVPAGSASAAASNAASKSVSSAGGVGKVAIPGKGLGGIGGEDIVPVSSSSSSMLPPPSSRTIMPPPPPISSSTSIQSSSHRPPLDPFANTHQSVSASFVETAPVPTPGTPYLQSGRLFPPSVKGHIGLNPNTLKQMNAILKELNIPEEPIPTKRNCDLYDGVRKDALTLLILQKIALRKEGELDSKWSVLCEIKSAAKAAAEAAKAAAEAAAAAAALAAAEEAEKKSKKNAENAVEKKEGGNTEAEGGKGKEAPTKRISKAKRPRDESTSSNQGGGDAATATTAKGAGGKGSTPKKEKDGSAPKKRSRTKAKKGTTTPAATAAAPAQTGSSNATAPVVSSGALTAKNAPPLPRPPPPTSVAMTSASVSPMVAKSRPTTAKDSSSLPPALPPPSSGNNVGAIVGASIVPSSSAAPAPSSTATAAAVYSGKTANKPGRKPRGRKKAEAQTK